METFLFGNGLICNLGFDSLPTLPRRQAGGQAGAQPAVNLQQKITST